MLALTEALAHWNLSKQSDKISSTVWCSSTTPLSKISCQARQMYCQHGLQGGDGSTLKVSSTFENSTLLNR
jgi:hypothetical protein